VLFRRIGKYEILDENFGGDYIVCYIVEPQGAI
jgi:hypothetical protein